MIKAARLDELQGLLRGQQLAFNRDAVGRTLPVLFEKPGRHPGQLVGRSPYLQWVHAQAPSRCQGAVLPVRITGVGPNSLAGEVGTLAEAVA
jgi:tRNA-2-methylthio-N6-dimethylallyladenosine synthase